MDSEALEYDKERANILAKLMLYEVVPMCKKLGIKVENMNLVSGDLGALTYMKQHELMTHQEVRNMIKEILTSEPSYTTLEEELKKLYEKEKTS